MSKRDIALNVAKVAGYHHDQRAFIRVIVESRIAWSFLNEAWRYGVQAKESGMKCTCQECDQPGAGAMESQNL